MAAFWQTRYVILTVIGCLLIAAFVVFRVHTDPLECACPGTNSFYVWQRHWSDKVEAAVCSELQAGTHDIYVLGGELEYGNGGMKWRGIEVPEYIWRYPRVTAVFRIPVQSLGDPLKAVAEVISHAGVLGVCRVQIDADVPESMMLRYAQLLEEIRLHWPEDAGSLQLGATFLPCHLNLKDIRRVLSAIDEPVIQLHGIDVPKKHADSWTLMDRNTVFRTLRTARALDGRFKMALPSYAYVLTFNADGSFRRLYAEGFPDDFDLPAGTVCELAAPDIDLLCEIFKSPLRLPVIWFRLPVRGLDRWCLERETLSILERGERPVPTVEFTVNDGGRAGTIELVACYRHQIPISGVTAEIDWGGGEIDGEFFPMKKCRVESNTVHGRLPDSVYIAPFACGEPFVVGKAITQADPKYISVKEEKKK